MDINKIIKEEIKNVIPKFDGDEIKYNQLMFNALFDDSLNEIKNCDDNKRSDVISKLKNNDFEKSNSNHFSECILNNKHVKMSTPYTVNDLNAMKLFIVNGYDIGYALKLSDIDNNYSEIVAVFNNEPDVCDIGTELIQSAVNNGGCHLDHFDGFLSNLYKQNGFIETHRFPYDPQQDKDGDLKKQYGEVDVIYRTHVNYIK